MRKVFSVILLLGGALSGYSQGQVAWGDYLSLDFQITIWSPSLLKFEGEPNFLEQLGGNSPANFGTGLTGTGPDIPPGVQTGYTGVPLGGSPIGRTEATDYANGNLWSVNWMRPRERCACPLAQPVPGTVASMFISGNAGLFNAGAFVTIPGVPAGSVATLQVRAWYNAGGLITSYEEAVSSASCLLDSPLPAVKVPFGRELLRS